MERQNTCSEFSFPLPPAFGKRIYATMTVENWTALLVLVFLCVLLLLLILYIVRSLRQWQPPRARDDAAANMGNPHTAHFQVNAPMADEAETEYARALWDTLTKREKQVARLAAQKLSDAQIAAQLGISERTVGNHLYSIYSKLEIHSRHELKFILRQVENE